MAKTTLAPFGGIERIHWLPLHLLTARHHHLADAVAVVDSERLAGEVNQDGLNLATIVGINGARRIEDRDAMLGCQAAARTNLRLKTSRQRDGDARRHQATLHGLELQRLLKIGTQVHSRRQRSGIRGQRIARFIDNLNFQFD